ncbi:MAG: DEAD/DEAH box helicase [Thermodesulfobacteriota bacterium]
MLEPVRAPESARQPLVAAFDALPPIQQAVVELLAIIVAPIRATPVVQCLSELDLRRDDGRLYTSKRDILPLLERLTSDGLVKRDGEMFSCQPLIMETAARKLARQGRFAEVAKAIWYFGAHNVHDQPPEESLFITVRIDFYNQDVEAFYEKIRRFNKRRSILDTVSPFKVLCRILENPFDPQVIEDLSPAFFLGYLWDKAADLALPPELEPHAIPLLRARLALAQPGAREEANPLIPEVSLLLLEQLILRGDWPEAQGLLADCKKRFPSFLILQEVEAWLLFAQGRYAESLKVYQGVLQQAGKRIGKRKVYLLRPQSPLYVLALIRSGSEANRKTALAYAQGAVSQDRYLPSHACLASLVRALSGEKVHSFVDSSLLENTSVPFAPLLLLLLGACHYWTSTPLPPGLEKRLQALAAERKAAGSRWLAAEVSELLVRLGLGAGYGEAARTFREAVGWKSLLDAVGSQQPWERALDALTAMGPGGTGEIGPDKEIRLAWQLTVHQGGFRLEPKEQRRQKNGAWTQGRNVALKRLQEKGVPFMSEQDRRVCAHLKAYRTGYYGAVQYEFAPQALLELVGHPAIFRANHPETRVELVRHQPELLVRRKKSGGIIVELVPYPGPETQVIVQEESHTRFQAIAVTAEHHRIAGILGRRGLSVPSAAQARLMSAVGAVAGLVTVHSDVAGDAAAGVETVEADARPCLLLRPKGEGLTARLRVRPLGADGPTYLPGQGGATVIAEVAGKRLLAQRDLARERSAADQLLADSAVLAGEAEETGDAEWLVPGPEPCLDLLQELLAQGEAIIVAWPEGQSMKVLPRKGPDAFRLRIRSQKDWFAIDGDLMVDDHRVLALGQLLDLLGTTPGRYLPLGQGEFLALTAELRKRIDELAAFTQSHGKGLRLHPLASQALSGLLAEAGSVEVDRAWQAHLKRLDQAQSFEPLVPSTLRAELRDYQREGFAWLARLAHLGMGACLADDMGLGKTVQALALLLLRAKDGPALVVAPTSVCPNWLDEAVRFAPSLRFAPLGQARRQETVAGLGPFDVLVVSYGLLQTEGVADLLAEGVWSTVILDEAQAIKNVATRRSQAAMRLAAGFRLLTTGTPIENNLGELWNLFRFLNPGLLGSLEGFNQRFADPIERQSDKGARRRLKRLIQPFILRRTKAQVLEELPPRTDIILHVDLSAEEMAFYEALRQKALAAVATAEGSPGAQHLRVLAEIMRLRRACCDPRLVLPEAGISGSKLAVFGEVVEELVAGRHRALVFSQFVDHLALVRGLLDGKGISYQYLDGSTPVRDRKRAVDAFQAGEGEVFLISLKAGGTGLNLTAADFVIHLDPWWNPAVEDQASDRAHRIGQERPVTVYRLVARRTIEEKIVALHQTKRDLADNLLAGTDTAGRISTEDLVRLMRGDEAGGEGGGGEA